MIARVDDPMSLAVLIDADNASPKVIKGMLAEIAKLGNANIKRIYGDWTNPNLLQWKRVLLEHSIQPIQQFCYTSKKNATDSALIIDAMDLLYTASLQGFCIVSSDSDFTRLASRIREAGKRVYGFGEKKTPLSFVAACSQFFHIDNLMASADVATCDRIVAAKRVPAPAETTPPNKPKTCEELRSDTGLIDLLREAVEAGLDKDGWTDLCRIGSHIGNRNKNFNSKKYGYRKLVDLVEAVGLYKIVRAKKVVLVQDKRAGASARWQPEHADMAHAPTV